MTWLHPALLLGFGLVALPVILHLLMRQKPKKLIFPALRLVQQRTKQNSRRLRLRQIWLLLLRMAVLAAIVAAVARPTLPAANYNPTWGEALTFAGVVAAGIGIYVYLLRRRRQAALPKHEFNLQRAQLRGWSTGLTLLAAILLAGFPYQRRIRAEITSPAPTGQFDLPAAAVFVFDTSLSMEYTQEGKTRLDAARQLATEHLQDFAAGSRIAIAETANDNPLIFQATLSSGQSRIDSLALSPVSLSLNDRVRAAVALQIDDRSRTLAEMGSSPEAARRDRFIRRIYVFTDLAATAWRLGASKTLQQELEKVPGLSLQIVDVGELQPRNTAILDVRLSRQRISTGGTLTVSADIAAVGESGDRKATLSLVSPNGQSVARSSQSHPVVAGGVQRFDFDLLTSLAGPVVHGEVRLASSDPLASDDVRHFTATVGNPPKVLVVSPTPLEGEYLLAALDPTDGREGNVKFAPVRIEPRQLGTADLAPYDVVYLIDVKDLADDTWSRLGAYVENGGGLAVILGSSDIDSANYNRAVPQQFLPAVLDAWHAQGDFRFSLDKREHPLFWRFRQYESYGSFAAMENDVAVMRFWKVDPAAGATILATYTDPQRFPSLLDRPHGKGRTVLFTTSVHLPDSQRNRWNTLPSLNIDAWYWLQFCEQLTDYLARTTELQFNVLAGEAVTLPVSPADAEREYLLRKPQLAQSRIVQPPGVATIVIDDTRDVGNYDLVPSGEKSATSGFSVNSSSAECDFTRVTTQEFEELLGKGRFQVARSLSELQTAVNVTDLGKEVFPLVLLLAIAAFLGEHFVANWFYDSDAESQSGDPSKSRKLAPPSRGSSASTPVATS